jgi:head-tail adaptor
VSGKPLAIGGRPVRDSVAQSWVKGGAEQAASANRLTARLTIDVTPALRGRIKILAFERGTTVAVMLRELLEREFGSPSEPPT